jgi:NAD(P)-dependent dehydrogenase (short-subunit alcohol dehydrogenase family)
MSQASESIRDRMADVRALDVAPQRVSVVTGGTDGIGRAVALELARGGDRVIFAGRDEARGAQVLAELKREGPGLQHAFIAADLSLLSEAERLAREVMRLTTRLDAVVCCAGILSAIPEWTAEGLERNFVLNYLSRYLLALRLLPALQEAASGRLVLVSNAGKYPDTLDFADLQHRRGKRGLAVAGRTQVANDLLVTELAERLRGSRVEVTCVFPGVTRSACFKNARGLPWLMRWLAPVLVRLFGHTPRIAAQTPVFLARHPAAVGTNGRFYGPKLACIDVPPRASNPERRAALWSASEKLVRQIW